MVDGSDSGGSASVGGDVRRADSAQKSRVRDSLPRPLQSISTTVSRLIPACCNALTVSNVMIDSAEAIPGDDHHVAIQVRDQIRDRIPVRGLGLECALQQLSRLIGDEIKPMWLSLRGLAAPEVGRTPAEGARALHLSPSNQQKHSHLVAEGVADSVHDRPAG